MVNNRHENKGFSNGRLDLKINPKVQYKATEEEFDKLIVVATNLDLWRAVTEFDYEAKLAKEKARTQELLKKTEQIRKEHEERIAQLQAEIRRLKNIIAEKEAAAATLKAAEGVAENVPKLVRPRKLNLEFSPAPTEPLEQPEVAVIPSPRPETASNVTQNPAGHLKPPHLPRKSSPAALFKISSAQGHFATKSDEENNNVDSSQVDKMTVESVVDGVVNSAKDQEVGTVLEFASAATTPSGELRTPTENGSAKFRRHARTASVVSRLIQGFEAKAAANKAPTTPTRAGSFRFNRRSLGASIS